jgi:SNF2 family DNA or RNA helicase
MINAHHCDIHPDNEVICTIKHEVAHALTPGHGHDSVWADKAKEIGCDNTLPCSHLNLPEHVIDAIRSGQIVEMTVEEETHVIRRPKYTVTRLQDHCPVCGKVAKEKFSVVTVDREGNDVKLITLECFHVIKKVIPRGTPFEKIVSNDWKPEIRDCKHEWLKNQCLKCGEFKLFEFQVVGARFIESALSMQKGAGIFDDMGLGKTVQGLAYVKFHWKTCSPVLYVTKSAIKFQWLKQILRWLGPEFMGQIIATSKDTLIPGLRSYIIPYDLLRRFPREKLAALKIKLVVLDECQQIKNPDSSRTQEVRKLINNNECKVIPLSGTPWKNRGNEFFPVLNMMDPVKFYSHQHFLETWVEYYWEGAKKKMGGIRNIPRFKKYTEGIMIRREYNEVMDEFPDINRMKMVMQLDQMAQSTYDDAVSEFVKWYNQAIIDGKEESLNPLEILAKMTRMRHITGIEKIPATLGFIEEFIEETERKLVVFVHHIDVGQLMYNSLIDTNKETNPDWYELAETLKAQGIEVMKLTAQLKDSERYDTQVKFNNSKRAVMIASTLASGEGIDLQTCADCVLHERQWNPQNEDQAAPGRFRRIGQLASVINITCTEAEDTVDQHLDGIVEGKRRRFHASMNKGTAPQWNQNEIARELASIIVAKYNAKHKHDTPKFTAIPVGMARR